VVVRWRWGEVFLCDECAHKGLVKVSQSAQGDDMQQQSQSEPQPRVPIPLTWLESTFNTRSRTEQLLRPELDDGVITQRDFDAAVSFFPSAQRYYSVRYPVLFLLTLPYILS
jgi:hypothetical protein